MELRTVIIDVDYTNVKLSLRLFRRQSAINGLHPDQQCVWCQQVAWYRRQQADTATYTIHDQVGCRVNFSTVRFQHVANVPVLSFVDVRCEHVHKRQPTLCLLAHRAVVVRLVKYGCVQVITDGLATVSAFEAVVAVASVRWDALALTGTVVETGAVCRATAIGRPAVITCALFQSRALAVAWNTKYNSDVANDMRV